MCDLNRSIWLMILFAALARPLLRIARSTAADTSTRP
jgi:hypothetical protein